MSNKRLGNHIFGNLCINPLSVDWIFFYNILNIGKSISTEAGMFSF